MNLDTLKRYISFRPYITEEYTEEQLEKTLTFAELILDIFFDMPEAFIGSKDYETALCEEVIYLLQNDPTSNYLTKYEGLSQFNVAGAIQGTVLTEYLPYISNIVVKYLNKFGILQRFDDNKKVSYGYTIY